MGVVQKNVKRVRREVREVVHRKFLQRVDHRLRLVRGLGGKPIGFELVRPRNDVQQNRNDELQGRVQQPEKDKSGGDGNVLHEERIEEPAVPDKNGEKEEQQSHVQYADHDPLNDMLFLIMPDFMCENADKLRDGVLRDQCIEQRNALVFPESGEKRIG